MLLNVKRWRKKEGVGLPVSILYRANKKNPKTEVRVYNNLKNFLLYFLPKNKMYNWREKCVVILTKKLKIKRMSSSNTGRHKFSINR